MKIKTDENLPSELADRLRQNGHDALSVLQQRMGGFPDWQIANACQAEQRVIVTFDLDFADVRVFPPQDYFGIIVLRPRLPTVWRLEHLISRVLISLESEAISQKLWIVDEHRIRIRG